MKKILSVLCVAFIMTAIFIVLSGSNKASAAQPDRYIQTGAKTTKSTTTGYCPNNHGSYTSPSLTINEVSTTVNAMEWINIKSTYNPNMPGAGMYVYNVTYVCTTARCPVCGYSSTHTCVQHKDSKQSAIMNATCGIRG